MTDWSSYDNIAARYDEVWGSRFEEVARHIGERVPLPRGSSVLDIGAGTGIVLDALQSRSSDGVRWIGCDRSAGMIRVARSRVPAARFVEANVVRLPFRSASFDAVTASFVLSHLRDCEAGLSEARRVLKPGGVLAMSSWAADEDVHGEAWRGLLADAIPKERVQAAVAQVAPAESRFERADGVERALLDAGFSGVAVHSLNLNYVIPVDHFLADREISSGGRFARHTLGAERWSRFLARAREDLERRFGATFACSRGVWIGVGTR
jgi:ubiquinone/menaquinone biosynthesis C-methylase UbiE